MMHTVMSLYLQYLQASFNTKDRVILTAIKFPFSVVDYDFLVKFDGVIALSFVDVSFQKLS